MPDRQIESLEGEAARCRRLAAGVGDARTVEALQQLARECDEKARGLRG